MSIINTVTLETAKDGGKELLELLDSNVGVIPKPLELIGVSSILSKIRTTQIAHYSTSNLSQSLMTFIRFMSADHCGSAGCVQFNGHFLKQDNGLSDADLDAIKNDTDLAPLDEKEKKLFSFVVSATRNPEGTSQDDIDELRELGWSDSDILEATYQSTDMTVLGSLMKIFKVSV